MLALQITGTWTVLLRTLPLKIPRQQLHQVIGWNDAALTFHWLRAAHWEQQGWELKTSSYQYKHYSAGADQDVACSYLYGRHSRTPPYSHSGSGIGFPLLPLCCLHTDPTHTDVPHSIPHLWCTSGEYRTHNGLRQLKIFQNTYFMLILNQIIQDTDAQRCISRTLMLGITWVFTLIRLHVFHEKWSK